MPRPPLRSLITLALALAVPLAAFGCGPSQQELDAALARNQELEQELQAARDRATALDAELAAIQATNTELAERLRALGQNVEELEGQRSSLQEDLERTRRALEELRERERQAQARLATFRGLVERFRALMESGQLRVRIVRNRMVVELPEGILFDSGQSALKPEGQETLSQVASVLAEIPNREYQIAGHSDNVPIRRRGGVRNNWDLSAVRAVNVAGFLISQGVPRERISAAGYADTQPVASNDTPEGQAQNRRIEIVLVPNLDELPDLSSLEGLGSD